MHGIFRVHFVVFGISVGIAIHIKNTSLQRSRSENDRQIDTRLILLYNKCFKEFLVHAFLFLFRRRFFFECVCVTDVSLCKIHREYYGKYSTVLGDDGVIHK